MKTADEKRNVPLEAEYDALVKSLPTRAPIFLPTERLSLDERLRGIKRVKALYDGRLEAEHAPRLRALRDKHLGQNRCFIIGNGPSLNKTDLELLSNEITIATNGFFLKSRNLSWKPSYYIVEDHLVGEDRSHWINRLKGSTKLFPAYLSYCIDDSEDVIFFNHRPRKSYPDGFDFSLNADKITYTGCTVTFTAMQLASFMGFEEIYLIGVDADYDIPKDVEQSGAYGTGVLDMKSDDPNHFDPSYFGKGYRWHDPQVEKMIEAYREARKAVSANNQAIYNAGIGGKLEVFERRPFQDVIKGARDPHIVELENERLEFRPRPANGSAVWSQARPVRILSLDLTQIGDGTATGEIKRTLYEGVPDANLLQVFKGGGLGLCISHGRGAAHPLKAEREFDAIVDAFDPTVIVYRPVPNQKDLHRVAMHLIERSKARLVTWIMDDWPKDLEENDHEQFEWLNRDFKSLLAKSASRLSICDTMSAAFAGRYGLDFTAVANGVDPKDWGIPRVSPPGEFVLRYAGSLAKNMTYDSILRVAAAIEELRNEGHAVRLEIRTRAVFIDEERGPFDRFKATHVCTELLSDEDYREWIKDADALLLAYNFDEKSLAYTRYSLANKMPECLAAGSPLLVHGPLEQATVNYLSKFGVCQACVQTDLKELKKAILELVDDPFLRLDIAERGQHLAFQRHHVDDSRAKLRDELLKAHSAEEPADELGASSSKESPTNSSKPRTVCVQSTLELPRSSKARVDETEVVAHLLSKRVGEQHVMFDVGAHQGTSAAYFDKLNWTIHCFEPDINNRSKLIKRFGENQNVIIDPRAISERPQRGLEFFASAESTGISGLHAFRSSHRVVGKVDSTTVRDVIKNREIRQVDFLKVDAEGFDLSVLKGVSWEALKPDVVEAEFEDAKTIPLGHTYRELCELLSSKGYTVYISEWHPVIRYGIAHDWRRLIRYPDGVPDPSGWGNVLAFLNDPGEELLQEAFRTCMKVHSS